MYRDACSPRAAQHARRVVEYSPWRRAAARCHLSCPRRPQTGHHHPHRVSPECHRVSAWASRCSRLAARVNFRSGAALQWHSHSVAGATHRTLPCRCRVGWKSKFQRTAWPLAPSMLPVRGRDLSKKTASTGAAYWQAAAVRRDEAFTLRGRFGIRGASIGDAEPEGRGFSCSKHFAAMEPKHGFVEAWRLLHPNQRSFSWYSRRNGKDLHGFRIDHAFVSEQLRERLVSCQYSDIERFAATSDHAALLLDLRLPLTHVVLHA